MTDIEGRAAEPADTLSPADRYQELEELLIQQHDWDNPQVTATVLEHASAGYAEWVERVTRKQV